MKILIFDTETTGLPERNSSITETDKWPHILQLSYILFDQCNNQLLTYSNDYIFILSTVEITEKSQSIHNISREICNKNGKPIREVLNSATRQSKLIEENGINFIVGKPLHLYCRRVDVLESFKFERIEGAREQHEAVANVRIDQNTGKQVNAGLVAVVKVIDN